MSNPTISEARRLAVTHRKRGVLILSFADSQFALASYGMTRRDCDAMKTIANQIGDMLGCGDIEVPAVLGAATSGVYGDGESINAELLEACRESLELSQRLVEVASGRAEPIDISTALLIAGNARRAIANAEKGNQP